MRVISRKMLREFWGRHPRAKAALMTWFQEACRGHWRTPQDIRNLYPRASFVGRNRVVFDISGNRYRLVTMIHYERSIVYIRFVGTHRQYDNIDVENI